MFISIHCLLCLSWCGAVSAVSSVDVNILPPCPHLCPNMYRQYTGTDHTGHVGNQDGEHVGPRLLLPGPGH